MRTHKTTFKHRVWLMLREAPATPHDVADVLGIHVHNARAVLFNLKKTGRALRLDRYVRKSNRTGLQREYLWGAV